MDLPFTGENRSPWAPVILALLGIPVVLILFGVLFGGTGTLDRSSQFIPAPDVAELALKAGLEAWKNGEPVGTVADTKPIIQLVDSHRKKGQVLSRYEILGQVPGNAPRCFAVKAWLSNPDKEERLRYVVLGIDPLWVWRQEDYDMLCHWEHPMEQTTPEKSGK
jgi:hypothetical protein